MAIAAQQPGEITLSGRDLTPASLAAAGQVRIPVLVTDAGGQGLAGLTASDFVVRADGKPVTVTVADSAAPRNVALLFDDASTGAISMSWARDGALAALPAAARSGERWAVLTTSGLLRVPFTSDLAAVRSGLRQLQSHAQQFGTTAAAGTPGRTERMHQGGSSDEMLQNQSALTLDRIGEALAYVAAQPGANLLVVVSTGFPTEFPANGANLDHALLTLKSAAVAAPVMINAIDPAALNASLSAATWQLELGTLSMLAQASGGQLADRQQELALAFSRFTAPGAGDYELAFPPPDTGGNARSLAIQVPSHAGAKVLARTSFAPPDSADAALDAKLRAALAGAKLDELPLEVRPEKWRPAPGASSGARLVVIFSPRALSFTQRDGRHQQHLRVAAVLSDRQGNWVAARVGDLVLNLRDDTLRKLTRDNIPVALELAAPPGTYHVVIVGQEALHGATTALAANLEIK